jgi:hypothetical protein
MVRANVKGWQAVFVGSKRAARRWSADFVQFKLWKNHPKI